MTWTPGPDSTTGPIKMPTPGGLSGRDLEVFFGNYPALDNWNFKDYVRGGQLVPDITENAHIAAVGDDLTLSQFQNAYTILSIENFPAFDSATYNNALGAPDTAYSATSQRTYGTGAGQWFLGWSDEIIQRCEMRITRFNESQTVTAGTLTSFGYFGSGSSGNWMPIYSDDIGVYINGRSDMDGNCEMHAQADFKVEIRHELVPDQIVTATLNAKATIIVGGSGSGGGPL